MKTQFFSLGFVVLAFASCKVDPVDPKQCNDLQLNQAVEVKITEEWCYVPEELSFEFEYIADGRCPKEVQCVWEGFASVDVKISQNSIFLKRDTLFSNNLPGVETDILLQGLRLTLLSVTPENSSPTPPAQSEYTLSVILQED